MFRCSLRLYRSKPSLTRKVRPVPFISPSGKFSVHTLYTWNCYPEQLFSSLVATVYSRLSKLWMKRIKKNNLGYRRRDACIKASILYVITHEDNILDRFLGMINSTPLKYIHGYLLWYACSMGANNRFVYTQAYFHRFWLMFRVSRPVDKSKVSLIGKHSHHVVRGMDFKTLLSMRPDFDPYVSIWSLPDLENQCKRRPTKRDSFDWSF